jgi:hypothetical protein
MAVASSINPTRSAFTTLMLIYIIFKNLEIFKRKLREKKVSRKVLYIENFLFVENELIIQQTCVEVANGLL